MTVLEIYRIVKRSRSRTLIACRFREVFGLEPVAPCEPEPISYSSFMETLGRSEAYRLMSQDLGALDRVR